MIPYKPTRTVLFEDPFTRRKLYKGRYKGREVWVWRAPCETWRSKNLTQLVSKILRVYDSVTLRHALSKYMEG